MSSGMDVECCAPAASPQAVKGKSVNKKDQGERKSSRKVLIFDWDDTLLCSTWLAGQGFRLDTPAVIPPATVAELKRLEKAVLSLLQAAQRYGEVVIITNAETGWVELSAQRFLPGLAPLVKTMKVVSARSTYERAFPDNPYDWKVAAFRHEVTERVARWKGEEERLKELRRRQEEEPVVISTTAAAAAFAGTGAGKNNLPSASSVVVPSRKTTPEPVLTKKGLKDMKKGSSNSNNNKRQEQIPPQRTVISFGDSVHERDAVWTVTEELDNAVTKSIKFVERPTLEQLCREVNLVRDCLEYVCTYDGDLDLMLTISLLDNQNSDTSSLSDSDSSQGQSGEEEEECDLDLDLEFDDEEEDEEAGRTMEGDDSEGGAVTPSSSGSSEGMF